MASFISCSWGPPPLARPAALADSLSSGGHLLPARGAPPPLARPAALADSPSSGGLLYYCTASLRPGDNRIGKRSDTLDVNGHRITRSNRADARWCSGRDDVARQQRHDRGDEFNQVGNRENLFARPRVLTQIA